MAWLEILFCSIRDSFMGSFYGIAKLWGSVFGSESGAGRVDFVRCNIPRYIIFLEIVFCKRAFEKKRREGRRNHDILERRKGGKTDELLYIYSAMLTYSIEHITR